MRHFISFILFISIFTSSNVMANQTARLLFMDNPSKSGAKWVDLTKNEKDSIQELLRYLERSVTASKVLALATKKAAESGQKLGEVINAGDGSVCDTTLLRKFYPNDPTKVIYETRSKVFLNRQHTFIDGMLDLIHELTHYTYRLAFNPYDGLQRPNDFIASTIEGRGGEVDAYMVECKVYEELYPTDAAKDSNCAKIKDANGKLDRTLAIKEFYQVGSQYQEYLELLKVYNLEEGHFPFLGKEQARYISSAYGLPYPVAALKEYEAIMTNACKNDQQRMVLLKEQGTRFPASANGDYYIANKQFLERCGRFLPQS